MIRVWRIAGLMALTAWLFGAPALAETRLALVIGNSNYKSVTPLPNPVNDAKAIADDLKAAAFDVTLADDLGQSDLRRAIRDFASKIAAKGPDTVALVYYAGHGVQVDGENFLVPVDARIQREADIPIEAVRLADIMSALAAVPSKMRIVILDACRNNPFATEKSVKGLAIVDAPTGSIVAYSTAPGTAATDGAGTNSPYTQAFLDVSREPHLQIEQLFKQVRLKVHEATKGQQTPWESSSLTSNFWFLPSDEVAPSPNAVATAGPAGPATSRQSTLPSAAPEAATAVATAPAAPAATAQAADTMPATQPAAQTATVAPQQPGVPSPSASRPTTFQARVAPQGPAPAGPDAYAPPGPPPVMPVADMRMMSADDAYDYAISEDTVDAYEQFLLVYPGDPRADWVRTTLALRVDAIAWRYASVVNTPDAYAAYAAAYPGGVYVEDAVRLRVRPRLRPIDVVIAPRVLVAPAAPRIALPLIQMRRAPGAAITLPVVLSRPGRFNERARFAPGPRVPGTNPAFAPRFNANATTNTPHINSAVTTTPHINSVVTNPNAAHLNNLNAVHLNTTATTNPHINSAVTNGPGTDPRFRRSFNNQPPVATVAPTNVHPVGPVGNVRPVGPVGNVHPAGPQARPVGPQFRPQVQRAQAGPRPAPAKCNGKDCKR
jgi:uncharacterized caspase-like protein